MIEPMLAKPVGDVVPRSDGLAYEPKWDGFRCLVERDNRCVRMWSRNGEDLAYLFPEVVARAEALPPGTVLDGELIVVVDGRLNFETLGQRIRPRSEAGGWKIAQLADLHPAEYVAFDLLRRSGDDLLESPFRSRRSRLEDLALPAGFHLTALTLDPVVADRWFVEFEGAGLDGIICKPLDDPYAPGKRTMLKVKHIRTADVVVAGWSEYAKRGADGGPLVGSMLLGLYDDEGRLHHVGAAGSFRLARRAELLAELAPFENAESHPWLDADDDRRVPGTPSRWSRGKSAAFHALRPELVAEVKYDHMQSDRFRHVSTFLRWRQDRDPRSCTYAQLERPGSIDLATVLAAGRPAR